MKRQRALLLSVLVTLFTALVPALQVSAGSLTLNGEILVTGPFWQRPLAPGDDGSGNYSVQGTCSALDVYPDMVGYNLWYFHVTESGPYEIFLNTDDPALDGHLVLYGGDAPYPGEFGNTPCLANIDDNAAIGSCCPVMYADLEAGFTYTLVVTTFDDNEPDPTAGELGTYALEITGPGDIFMGRISTDIPALPAWGLAMLSGLLGLWGLVTLRKRRS